MAETIGTYYFQLAPTTEGIGNSISQALGNAGEQSGKSFSGSFSKVLGTSGAIIGGIATAVGAIGTSFVNAATNVASYGDSIDKMSQKMGISAEAYQEWDAVMQHSGTSMDSLKASMKTMANAALTGNEAFQALGISEKEVGELSQEDLFSRVISGLQGMEEGTERTYLAGQLLGRGATELGALLNTSAEDTQAMKDEVHALGGVLSDDAVKSAAAFQDQLQDMQTSFQSIGRNLISEFLPGITTAMSGLTDIFKGGFFNQLKGQGEINKGIDEIITQITNKIPEIMKIGSTIILALANSLISNLPSLITTGMSVLESLLLGITQMLPRIVEMAGTIIVEIVNGLTEAAPILIPAVISAALSAIQALINELPTILTSILGLIQSVADSLLNDGLPLLLEKLPDIILGICDFVIAAIPQIMQSVNSITLAIVQAFPSILDSLTDSLPLIITGVIDAILSNLPLFVDAGIQLFVGLIAALPQIIVAIVSSVPKIVQNLITAFKNNGPKMKESGKKLLTSLGDGLKNLGNTIKDAVSKIWNAIKTAFTNHFSIIKEIGGNIIKGLADGITSKISSVVDTAKSVASSIADAFTGFFGISSPSKLFAEYGQYIDEGFAEGISDNQKVVSDAMDDLNSSIVGDIKTNASVAYDSGFSTRCTAANDSKLIDLLAEYLPYLANGSNVNVTFNTNAKGIFDIVKKENNDYKKQRGISAFV